MKIVLLLSGREVLPKGLFDAACALNEKHRILLIGVFLPKEDYQNTLWYYSGGAEAMILDYDSIEPPTIIAEAAIAQFKKLCLKNGIEYRVHEKENINISEELKKETRFADLMLLSNDEPEEEGKEATQPLRAFTGGTLHHSECPVLIIPTDFQQPTNIILAYDGSAASVFSIKQFAALLPELTSLETLLVYMNADPKTDLPDGGFIEELAARHFNNLTFCKINLAPDKPTPWIREKKKTLLVTGSFGRSGISRALRSSFASDILKAHEMVVFTAHKG